MTRHDIPALAGLALLVAAAPAVAGDAAPGTLTPAERAAGWQVLFDGTSTAAWRGYRRPGFPTKGWVVRDGALGVTAGGGGGDIITKQLFENFELVLEWKCSEKANSGIMYRVTEEYGAPWQSGPEMQILEDTTYGVGRLDGHASGALYDLYTPAEAKVLHPAGEWNVARIVIRDGLVKQYLNGVKVVEADMNGDEWAHASPPASSAPTKASGRARWATSRSRTTATTSGSATS